jgi:glycosyltransferase involved in cell wall biosynthesis
LTDVAASNCRIFIVIAAYDESSTARQVIERLLLVYPSVVVVDDGSTDDTYQQLEDLDLFLLRHIVNRGQGASLQTGIRFALQKGADVIVTFDADGQHQEKDIRALVEPILRGDCDVCLGSRFLGRAQNIPLSRRLTLKAGVVFTRVFSGIRVTDVHNGLRAFSREAAQSICITMDRMAHASELLDQLKQKKLRFEEVPVDVLYSRRSLSKGQSSWNAFKIAFDLLYRKLTQ